MHTFAKSYVLKFPLELVYANWISEKTVIAPAARMEIEPRAGGLYRLIMSNDATMTGIFSEVLANRRLRYSWQWEGSDEKTEIAVVFEPHPDGTTVHLTHRGFQSSISLDNHSTGWDSYIDGFSTYLRKSQLS